MSSLLSQAHPRVALYKRHDDKGRDKGSREEAIF